MITLNINDKRCEKIIFTKYSTTLSNSLGFKKIVNGLNNLGPYKYSNKLSISKHPLNVHVYIILIHISIFGFNKLDFFFEFFLCQFFRGDI
jgi:hypothetical protein